MSSTDSSANQQKPAQEAAPAPRPRLPFDNRRPDIGTWTYNHRVGICVTLIVYLSLMIAFVTARIVIEGRTSMPEMIIDQSTLAALEQTRDALQQQVEQQQQQEDIDWSSIRNRVSNENALNEDLKDDRGTNAAALNQAAADAEQQMRANREIYESALSGGAAAGGGSGADRVAGDMRANGEAYRKGLADADAAGRRGTAGEHRDTKVKGRVVVSFSLIDPVRQSRRLEVPAYRCEGGGEVVVEITVGRDGSVLNARVKNGGDDCMRESALQSARISQFNIDNSAPVRQQGTITYIFIPQ